jgi:hypothetical protein
MDVIAAAFGLLLDVLFNTMSPSLPKTAALPRTPTAIEERCTREATNGPAGPGFSPSTFQACVERERGRP